MKKFGIIQGLDEAISSIKEVEDADVVPTESDIADKDPRINHLTVKRLPANDMVDKYKPVAASGNKPKEVDSEEPYPALEFGIGCGSVSKSMRKDMSRTESFDGTVDEAPFETARDDRQENTLETTDNMFKKMFGDNYDSYVTKAPKIDHDFTKSKTILKGPSETLKPFKVKRGW